MGGAVSRRRGRAWLYGLMLPKIQTDMLGTIPLRITWYMWYISPLHFWVSIPAVLFP